MDLLDLLGGEWASTPVPSSTVDDDMLLGEIQTESSTCSHSYSDRMSVTHGCAESGRPVLHWDDSCGLNGGYVDAMRRPAHCIHCPGCQGSGEASIWDPWTGERISWGGAPCWVCEGRGWTGHRYDCDGSEAHEPRPVARFGYAHGWGTVVAGELLRRAR